MHMSEVKHDQATGLRKMVNPKQVKVIAVSSGKGGVGKTNVSVNLATALAKDGKEVLLMDADLGLANVDVLLGLNPASARGLLSARLRIGVFQESAQVRQMCMSVFL